MWLEGALAVVAWALVICLAECAMAPAVTVHAQTYLPRQPLDSTSYGRGVIKFDTAAQTRAYLGITDGATNGNTFRNDQFTFDGDVNVTIKDGAVTTNLYLKGGENYVEFPNGNVDVTLQSLLELLGKDFRRFGASAGSADNYSAWTNAMANLEAGETLLVPDDPYILDTVQVTKDINIVGVNGGGFKHKDNATGDMLIWTVPSSGDVTGLTLDANIANQGTNTTYTLIYPKGAQGRGQRIYRNRIVGFMHSAIKDFATTGRLEIFNNEIVNGYKPPLAATNVAVVNAAIWLAPGITNNRPQYYVHHNSVTNTEPLVTERLPGGVVIFGAQSVEHFNYAEVTHNYFNWVGGDSVGVAHHVGTAAIDWYRHTMGLCAWNVITNAQFYGVKTEQSSLVDVVGNIAHSTGSGVYKITPGERDETNTHRMTIFENNKAFRGANDTIALYVSSGAKGFRETLIKNLYAPGFERVIQLMGQTSGASSDGQGPVVIEGLYADATEYVLSARYITGSITLRDWEVSGSGAGSCILMYDNVTGARLVTDNVRATTSGTGWAARVEGVDEWISIASKFTETGTGEAVQAADDSTSGENIGKLYFDRSTIISGDVDIVTADVDEGYWWNGNVMTLLPSGATVTIGNGTTTYLEDVAMAYAGAVLGRREGNMTPGGAWIRTWIATNTTGQVSIFGSDYSDSDRRGRFSIRAESNAVGVDVDSVAVDGSVRLRATQSGGTVAGYAGSATLPGFILGNTNFAVRHNISVPGRAYNPATWDGQTNVVTEDAMHDALAGVYGAHTVKEEGSGLTARKGLNFGGGGVTASDDAGNNETDVNITRTGVYRTHWFEAKELTASGGATNGVWTGASSGGFLPEVYAILMDGATTETVQWGWELPGTYASGGTIKLRINWMADAGSSGQGVRWSVKAFASEDDGEVATTGAVGAVNVTGTIGTAATRRRVDELTVTLNGLDPDPGDYVRFYLQRLGGDAADTHASDVYLLGVQAEWQESSTEPSAL